jgi:branched-subunit amino acid ABC-type transport system permease component
MITVVEAVLEGLGRGSVYALIAIGFVIIFKSSHVISFAQPGFMIAGVVLITYLVQAPFLGFWTALALGAVLIGLLALGVERTVIRPMVGRPIFAIAIITIALDIIIRTVAHGFIGTDVRHVNDPWGRTRAEFSQLQVRHLLVLAAIAVAVALVLWLSRTDRMSAHLFHAGTATVRQRHLAVLMIVGATVAFVVWLFRFSTVGQAVLLSYGPVSMERRHIASVITAALLVTLLLAFFRYTRIGLAMRAVAQDQEAALAQGVSVSAVFAVSWALAGGLAAVAGGFAASGVSVDNTFWLIALFALPVIILGGLDSLEGAVIAGLVIGAAQSVFARFPDLLSWLVHNPSVIVPWLVMVIVLIIRPYGLFGTREVERV